MRYAVIDTNVLIVANGGSDQADDQCRRAVERALNEMEGRRSLVLDMSGDIQREYYRNINRDRQAGVGDRFFRRAFRSDVRWVRLTAVPGRGYEEFPDDRRLEEFDRDDRKFVAATVASGTQETELLNAVDSDYSHHRVALREAGVRVRELCPQAIRRDG